MQLEWPEDDPPPTVPDWMDLRLKPIYVFVPIYAEHIDTATLKQIQADRDARSEQFARLYFAMTQDERDRSYNLDIHSPYRDELLAWMARRKAEQSRRTP